MTLDITEMWDKEELYCLYCQLIFATEEDVTIHVKGRCGLELCWCNDICWSSIPGLTQCDFDTEKWTVEQLISHLRAQLEAEHSEVIEELIINEKDDWAWAIATALIDAPDPLAIIPKDLTLAQELNWYANHVANIAISAICEVQDLEDELTDEEVSELEKIISGQARF